jgi:glutaredoxin
MYKILLFIFTVFFSLQVLADGSFCYRESGGTLICKESMDKIPEEFQRRAFFVTAEIDSGSPSASRRESRSSLSSERHEILSPPSDTRKVIPRRDPPLSAGREVRIPSETAPATTAKQPPSGPAQGINTATTQNTRRDIEEPALPPPVIKAPPIQQTHDSGLPPAKGYVPEKELPDVPPQKSASEEILQTEEIKPRSAIKPSLPVTKETTGKKNDSLLQIFVADWCAHCKALEDFLVQEKISYDKFDVEKDPNAIRLYEEHGSVPISKIGNNIVVGFEAERFRALIDANTPY